MIPVNVSTLARCITVLLTDMTYVMMIRVLLAGLAVGLSH